MVNALLKHLNTIVEIINIIFSEQGIHLSYLQNSVYRKQHERLHNLIQQTRELSTNKYQISVKVVRT